MEGWWTALFESDADWVAPKLSKCGGLAGAMYLWLLSRASSEDYSVRVSEVFLAREIGVSRSSARRAISQLVDEGLVRQSARPGNGGGSTFHLLGLQRLNGAKLCGAGKSPPVQMFPNASDGGHQMSANGPNGEQQMSKSGVITKTKTDRKKKEPYDF